LLSQPHSNNTYDNYIINTFIKNLNQHHHDNHDNNYDNNYNLTTLLRTINNNNNDNNNYNNNNDKNDHNDEDKGNDNDDKVMMEINKTLQNVLRITYYEKCKLENLLRNASLQLWYMRGQTIPYENPYL
jgi:hypothetical protein